MTFSFYCPIPDYDQLAKDFTRVFLNIEPSCIQNAHLFDVVFLVGQSKQKARFIGVRAILGVRSRVFQVGLRLETRPYVEWVDGRMSKLLEASPLPTPGHNKHGRINAQDLHSVGFSQFS